MDGCGWRSSRNASLGATAIATVRITQRGETRSKHDPSRLTLGGGYQSKRAQEVRHGYSSSSGGVSIISARIKQYRSESPA